MNHISVFRSGRAQQEQRVGVDGVVDNLTKSLGHSRHATEELARQVSTEGYSGLPSELKASFNESVQMLNLAMEEMVNTLNATFGDKYLDVTNSQRDAAVVAGIAAAAPRAYANRESETVSFESLATRPNQSNVAAFNSTMVSRRLSLESYDERDNKSVVAYSMAYNLQAARQDAFGEAFFPTVVVAPEQVGYAISVRLIQVFQDQRRAVSGVTNPNFGRKNIIQAVIDPSILASDSTKIYPVYQTAAAQRFVDQTLVPAKTVLVGQEEVDTAPLAMGQTIDLLGISQTDALLQTGILDSTDAVDNAVTLENLYMSVQNSAGTTKEVLVFPTIALPMANFVAAPQGMDRLMNLNFTTQSLLVNNNTLTASGTASSLLSSIVSGNYVVRLSVSVFGQINTNLASLTISAGNVQVVSVQDSTGAYLSLTTGEGQQLAALFTGASVFGYDIDARRSNLNRRERGMLLDTSTYTQVYQVPLLAPITVLRPMTSGSQNDASDLAALITATNIRTSNSAVAEIFNVAGTLAAYIDNTTEDNGIANFNNSVVPDVMGAARFLVQPFYDRQTLDLSQVVDSLTSSARFEDIRSAIINKVRDMAYRMYRDSGYKAAADALNGGVAPVPTLIIGTDPVIARYLIVEGDLRTASILFNVKIVDSLNIQMKDKIVMSFGTTAAMDGTPDPLHFGNMAWKPELTIVLPLHRNGANSKELTVCPAYRHFANLPVLAILDVTGIEALVDGKVTINTSK